MMLNARQIEAFRMVMLRGSVTGAARAMNVSQPAVSRLLRDLEARIGLTLFERRGNQLIPTSEATILLDEIERYMIGLSALGNFVRDLAGQKHGSVRIAAMPALAMGFLPRHLADYARSRPGLHIHLNGMPSHLVNEAVAAGQADVGFAAAPDERPGLDIEHFNARLVVALPAQHPLARRRRLSPADLAGEKIIALSEPAMVAETSRVLTGVFRNATFTTPLTGIACQLAASGAGLAIVDPFSVSAFHGQGLVSVPFEPAVRLRVALIRPANRPMAQAAADLVDSLRQAVARTIRAGRATLPA